MPDGVCGWLRMALCWWALLLAGVAWAQSGVQPVPELTAHVMDASGMLTEPQRKALDDKLKAFEAASGAQVVVLIVRTTAPEDIASYANRVGNTWKIGRKDVGDGLILLVAKEDRKLRIEVAKTLEGAIPDLAAKRVIDEAITPRFKQGDFAGGMDAGVERIMALIRAEKLPVPGTQESAEPPPSFWWEDIQVKAVLDLAFVVVFGVFGGWAGVRYVLRCAAAGAVVGVTVGLLSGAVLDTFFWSIGGSFLWAVGEFIWTAAHYRPSASTVELKKNAGKNPWANAGPPIVVASSSSDSSWFSSSDSDSSSSSDSFSSGGGGDFGGGGASGDW